jgi:hypothetical protein
MIKVLDLWQETEWLRECAEPLWATSVPNTAVGLDARDPPRDHTQDAEMLRPAGQPSS